MRTGIAGLVLQALALRLGSVVVVQPVLASGLVVSLGIGFLVDRRHPRRVLPGRRQGLAALVLEALVTFPLVQWPGTWRGAALVVLGVAVGQGAAVAMLLADLVVLARSQAEPSGSTRRAGAARPRPPRASPAGRPRAPRR